MARSKSAPTFTASRPCKHCGSTQRWVSNRACCSAECNRRRYEREISKPHGRDEVLARQRERVASRRERERKVIDALKPTFLQGNAATVMMIANLWPDSGRRWFDAMTPDERQAFYRGAFYLPRTDNWTEIVEFMIAQLHGLELTSTPL